jgi:hypothetical protein
MGMWRVDVDGEPGILHLKLSGALTLTEMKAFVEAHNRAIDGYQGQDYRVWVDISDLSPLRPEVADVFEEAKRHSNEQPNFRGSAVLASGATVAMQHRRTSLSGGVMATELISGDPAALRAHLRTIHRRSP